MPSLFLTMRQQWFTHVRLLVAHLTRWLRAFPQSLPTPALDRHDTAAVWDLRLYGEPGGPPSITGTARFMLAIFYIVITPLSGHTWGAETRSCGAFVLVKETAESISPSDLQRQRGHVRAVRTGCRLRSL